MFYCHDGMIERHQGSGEGHDLSDLRAILLFIAVGGAFFARGFVPSVGAFFESIDGVGEKPPAIGTEVLRFVLFVAVNSDHCPYGFDFAVNSTTTWFAMPIFTHSPLLRWSCAIYRTGCRRSGIYSLPGRRDARWHGYRASLSRHRI